MHVHKSSGIVNNIPRPIVFEWFSLVALNVGLATLVVMGTIYDNLEDKQVYLISGSVKV